jgi:hypothetical protein
MLNMRQCLLGIAILASSLLVGCSRSEPTLRTFQMGERAEVGRLIYTTLETRWLTQIGEMPDAKIPKNRFLLIRVSIANSGSGDLLAPSLSLVGDDGQTIPELTDAQGAPQWIGALRSVKPAEAAQGNVVFDAPPRHYKLRVADENDENAALIDIPLSFGSALPPAPGSPTGTREPAR